MVSWLWKRVVSSFICLHLLPQDHGTVLILSEGENEMRKVGWKYLRLQSNSKKVLRLLENSWAKSPLRGYTASLRNSSWSLIPSGTLARSGSCKMWLQMECWDFKEQQLNHCNHTFGRESEITKAHFMTAVYWLYITVLFAFKNQWLLQISLNLFCCYFLLVWVNILELKVKTVTSHHCRSLWMAPFYNICM